MLKIKIGGIPHTVKRITRTIIDVNHDESDPDLWGQIDYRAHSIRFLKSDRDTETHTVIHEILHGIIQSLQIRELMPDGNHSEIAIEQLSVGLTEVLKSMHVKLPLDKA